MKKLNVQVISGLGSRMRAVLAAIAYGKAHGLEVVVHWPRIDPSETLGVFPVGFSQLFRSPLAEVEMGAPVKSPDWRKAIQPYGDGFCIRFCEPEVLEIDQLDLTGWPYPDLWRPGPAVCEAAAAVDWCSSVYRTVGVHIRHSLAQNTTPPVEWFLERMAALASTDWRVRFFLATDAQIIEDRVRERFPAVMCQNKGDYAYDRQGIIRAAADLFLLHRCDWMIGSYGSSFSELAGWLRGGAYLPGWGRPGWMPGGRYEDLNTTPDQAQIERALA